MLEQLRQTAVAIATKLLGLVSDPGERAYWLFLLTGLAIGLAVCARRSRSLRGALAALATPRIWWHRSARMDYRLIVANGAIQVLLLAPLALSALAIATVTVDGLTWALGEPTPSRLPTAAIVALYTVVLFVGWDLSRYVVHRLLHQIPVLWEFHKVHHSAEVLTPLTVYRVHPVESLLFRLRGALTTGVVTGVFFYAFQDRAVQYELLGVNALGVAFTALAGNLRHSHVWLGFGPRLERWLMSPAQHQLHHSVDPVDYDCNYGTFLSIWDRLCGSLRVSGRRRRLRFGLTADQRNHHPASATAALAGPFTAIARRLFRGRRAIPAEETNEATVV